MSVNFTERRGKIEQLDRSFDLKFRQARAAKARFDPSSELVVHYMKVKGQDVRQFRLQRNDVETFGRQSQ